MTVSVAGSLILPSSLLRLSCQTIMQFAHRVIRESSFMQVVVHVLKKGIECCIHKSIIVYFYSWLVQSASWAEIETKPMKFR